MSVIIDQFEVVVDSQQEQSQKKNDTEFASQQTPLLKPHNVASILKQIEDRNDRVKAH